ncbi:helix-turn-helix domain-containing protein [Hymenobacter chitinivorans]|uniref:Uncharacterized protein n=1 Tax=Hymenobacter chitinivorans DSM 11115 TaxID=1121954 RepID=A0A2M9BA39_9BACT|nr:helix-turn-helix domain-containing protein [Hymenobacter chitinivorans]PJJ54801.1 hypothetical protein CLV45_3147 [Hymenobacter chitinivorans DSM 11115]
MPEAAPAPEESSFVERFAQRVARRDQPPPRPDYGPGQAGVEACLAAALPARFHYLHPRRARTFAQVCYALMEAPRLNLKALADATGKSRLALYKALPELEATGLVASERVGGRHDYFLTRPGEDWLLAVTS